MGAPMMMAQAAVAVIGAVSAISQARAGAEGAGRAAAANAAMADAELSREQRETSRVANDQLSDRQRAFAADLATIRVANAEGSALGIRGIGEAAYVAGLDLSRIEANRAGQIDALQAKKVAVHQGATDAILTAQNQYESAATGALLGGIGSGVQIGTNSMYRQQTLDAMKNTQGGR